MVMIQESRCSVLTNQCLGKEMNAEPPGRGTEESFEGQRHTYTVLRESHWAMNYCMIGSSQLDPAPRPLDRLG